MEQLFWDSKKNIKDYNEMNSIRGIRYFGPSKMSLFNLVIHSFSIIAVFKYSVFFRSTLLIIILSLFFNLLEINSFFLQVLLLLFNLIIFIISFRENEKDLLNSGNDFLNKVEISH